ncbi:MAG: class I SAM-dependent methyltransferase [bacterium]
MLKFLRLWWHGITTRRKMNGVFSRREDPYGYCSSPYETARLCAMEEALKGGRYAGVLEIGCAEGAFTEKLCPMASEIIAIDISPVALERAAKRVMKNQPGCTVSFMEADIRRWEPPDGKSFNAVVAADVLYYMDKPLVRKEFMEVLEKIRCWVVPGGTLMLAHGFANSEEKKIRQGYRKKFEEMGLGLVSEKVVGDEVRDKVCCLLSMLKRGNEPLIR